MNEFKVVSYRHIARPDDIKDVSNDALTLARDREATLRTQAPFSDVIRAIVPQELQKYENGPHDPLFRIGLAIAECRVKMIAILKLLFENATEVSTEVSGEVIIRDAISNLLPWPRESPEFKTQLEAALAKVLYAFPDARNVMIQMDNPEAIEHLYDQIIESLCGRDKILAWYRKTPGNENYIDPDPLAELAELKNLIWQAQPFGIVRIPCVFGSGVFFVLALFSYMENQPIAVIYALFAILTFLIPDFVRKIKKTDTKGLETAGGYLIRAQEKGISSFTQRALIEAAKLALEAATNQTISPSESSPPPVIPEENEEGDMAAMREVINSRIAAGILPKSSPPVDVVAETSASGDVGPEAAAVGEAMAEREAEQSQSDPLMRR